MSIFSVVIENEHWVLYQVIFRIMFYVIGVFVGITVYNAFATDKLRLVYKAPPLPNGSAMVDEAFIDLMTSTFGDKVMSTFRIEHAPDFISFMNKFEEIKQSVEAGMTKVCLIDIPSVLNDLCKDVSGRNIAEICKDKSYKYKDRVKVVSDKLSVDMEILYGMFERTTQEVVKNINDLMKTKITRGTCIIALVGGFAENEFVKTYINEKIHSYKKWCIYVPENPGLAVMKGGVIYGETRAQAQAREVKEYTTGHNMVLKYTFGSSVKIVFEEGKHPVDKKIRIGGTWCRNVFKPIIKSGTSIKIGHKISQEVETRSYEDAVFGLYMIENFTDNVHFVTDTDCACLMKFWVCDKLPLSVKAKSKQNQIYTVTYTFGEDNLTVDILLKETKQNYTQTVKVEYDE